MRSLCLWSFRIAVAGMWSVALMTTQAAQAQGTTQGPPAFLSFPKLELLDAVPQANTGHLIWTGDGFAPAPFIRPPAPGAPVPLAPRATAIPAASAVVNVSNAADSYQGETGAASNGQTVVGGSNSIYPGACASNPCYVRAYSSSDGVNWISTTLGGTWQNTTFGITFDPSIDYDTAGNYYFAFGGAPLRKNYPNSVAVSKAGPSGIAWSTPVAVTFNKNRYFDDKYYLAVDRSSSAFKDRVYVAWDRNTSTDQILYVSESSDGGATWSAPVKVDDGTSRFERVINAYPAVDQNTGKLYVSWHNYAQDVIYLDRSTDGGASFGTDIPVVSTHTGFGVDIGCNGGREQGPAHHLKVGPSGTLYLVYADQIAGKGSDILFTRSTNGGLNWTSPVTLNDDTGGAHQYHPTLNVTTGPFGLDEVSVSFYDRRNDPSNCLTEVYATRSMNSGMSWSANTRISTFASDFDGNPNGPGDYSSSTWFGTSAWPFHCQHPNGGDFDIWALNF